MNDGFEPPITEASNHSTWLTNVPKMLVYSMANLDLVINPMFDYLFGYGFRVLSVTAVIWG